MVHELKLATEWFDAVAGGFKRAELRRDDRSYHEDDVILLREW